MPRGRLTVGEDDPKRTETTILGGRRMDKHHANRNIRCNINECANHCAGESCCALDSIEIRCSGTNHPMNKECTECASFQAKSGY